MVTRRNAVWFAALFVFVATTILIAVVWTWDIRPGPGQGRFDGRLLVEVLSDGETLRVLEDFTFFDNTGQAWAVTKGTETDGASVPRFAWSLFPPFTGKHRIAAVVHDRYCQTRDLAWDAVHKMFYDAMIAAGVDDKSARTMFAAVYAFGPRWSLTGETRNVSMPDLSMDEQAEAFQALQGWIDQSNPNIDQIEKRVRESAVRQLGIESFN